MVDLSAIAKWPNVPACYGWLSLDRRGDWRLQGERVTHRGLIEFMNRQYGADESGCWFVQNGPQRVFVDLAYAPWVFRCAGTGFVAHTGRPAGAVLGLFLDEEGSLVLETELGVGLVDDRDLAGLLAECKDTATGRVVADDTLLQLLDGSGNPAINWRGLVLQRLAAGSLPARFGFNPNPQERTPRRS
jgi:hypothetical protein